MSRRPRDGQRSRSAVTAPPVERLYGHSIFASFYAGWSRAGVAAALLTSATSLLGWPVEHTLTVQAAVVAALVLGVSSHRLPDQTASDAPSTSLGTEIWARRIPFGIVLLVAYVIDASVSTWSTTDLHQTLAASLAAAPPSTWSVTTTGSVWTVRGSSRFPSRPACPANCG